MLYDGSKTFDVRRWDLSDDRIYRLSWGNTYWNKQKQVHPYPANVDSGWAALIWNPDVKELCFQNKATAAVLTFQYKGMEFASWAPGWVFLILGNIVGIQEVYREPVI